MSLETFPELNKRNNNLITAFTKKLLIFGKKSKIIKTTKIYI